MTISIFLFLSSVAHAIVWDTRLTPSYNTSIFHYDNCLNATTLYPDAVGPLGAIKNKTNQELYRDAFWRWSDTFEGFDHFKDLDNVGVAKQKWKSDTWICSDPGLKQEEPWKSMCSTDPHEFCAPLNTTQWSTYWQHWMGKSADYKQNGESSNDYTWPNAVGGNPSSGFTKLGMTGHQLNSFRGIINGTEKDIYYHCNPGRAPAAYYVTSGDQRYQNIKQTDATVSTGYYFLTYFFLWHGISGPDWSSRDKYFVLNECTHEYCFKQHATTLTDSSNTNTTLAKLTGGQRYWLLLHKGRVGCTAHDTNAAVRAYRKEQRDTFIFPWDGHSTWVNYLQTPSQHLWSDINDLAARHLPFWAGHPRQASLYKVWADTMVNANLQDVACWKRQSRLSARYLAMYPRLDMNNLGHEDRDLDYTLQPYFESDIEFKMRSNPLRILVEDAETLGVAHTWLKWKEGGHPYLMASSAAEVETTACGNGTAAGTMKGWSDWEVRISTLFCTTLLGCSTPGHLHPTWSNFKAHWTDQKSMNISHCYDHVYVPENKTLDQWSTKVCTDPRGCLPMLHLLNPCVPEVNILLNVGRNNTGNSTHESGDNTGPIDWHTNITWPRGGTFDSSSMTLSFNDTDLLADKYTYPWTNVSLWKHNITASSAYMYTGKPKYLCNPDTTGPEAGWFNGSISSPVLHEQNIKNDTGFFPASWFRFQRRLRLGQYENKRATTTFRESYRMDAGGLGNPGRRRRSTNVTAPYNNTLPLYDISTYNTLYPLDGSWDMHDTNGFAKLSMDGNLVMKHAANASLPTPEAAKLDSTFANYFNESAFNATELAWMKWGAHEYLWGNLDGYKNARYHKSSTRWPLYLPDIYLGNKGIFIGVSNMLTMEDSLDLRFPNCVSTPGQSNTCPDQCASGTEADIVIDCFMAIDYRAYQQAWTIEGGTWTEPQQTAITVSKETGCNYKILIEIDCGPSIVFFSESPAADGYITEAWQNETMLPLTDRQLIWQDYIDRLEAEWMTTTTTTTSTTVAGTTGAATTAAATTANGTTAAGTTAAGTTAAATTAAATTAAPTTADSKATYLSFLTVMLTTLLIFC